MNESTGGGRKPPDKRDILDKFTLNTDLSKFEHQKRTMLFEAAAEAIDESKGQLSKELRKIVKQMVKFYKKNSEENREMKNSLSQLETINEQLKVSNEKLTQENSDLRRPAIPPHTPRSSYANIVRNKKEEYVVLIKNKTEDKEINLQRELFKKLKSIENRVDIIDTKRKNDTLVVSVRNKEQQNLVCEKLNDDDIIECNSPEKRIPTIKIKEVDPSYDKTSVIEELEAKENINKEATNVKVILKNIKFRTNRVLVNFNKEDTLKIVSKGEVKIGCKIHPIELDYGLIQCKNCNKFGHFHKSKDGQTIKCKTNKPVCVHCTGSHDLTSCPVKNDRNKAKCSNCDGNHRAYDDRCPKRCEVLNKIKQKFIC